MSVQSVGTISATLVQSGQTKVRFFQVPVGIQEQVFWLQIPMGNVALM